MDILLALIVVFLAWIVFKDLLAVLIALCIVAVVIYIVRNHRAL